MQLTIVTRANNVNSHFVENGYSLYATLYISYSTSFVKETTFQRNEGYYGGAISAQSSHVTISRSSLDHNHV